MLKPSTAVHIYSVTMVARFEPPTPRYTLPPIELPSIGFVLANLLSTPMRFTRLEGPTLPLPLAAPAPAPAPAPPVERDEAPPLLPFLLPLLPLEPRELLLLLLLLDVVVPCVAGPSASAPVAAPALAAASGLCTKGCSPKLTATACPTSPSDMVGQNSSDTATERAATPTMEPLRVKKIWSQRVHV